MADKISQKIGACLLNFKNRIDFKIQLSVYMNDTTRLLMLLDECMLPLEVLFRCVRQGSPHVDWTRDPTASVHSL